MAKSNAQRQREWRQRQKEKKICAYGGCGEPVEPPATLCAEHLRPARSASSAPRPASWAACRRAMECCCRTTGRWQERSSP